MPEGPLGGPRPFGLGPLTSSEEEKQEETSEDINLDEIEDETVKATLEMAEKWYESITRDQSKHNMMKHYLQGVTELSDKEIEKILEKAGI